MSPASVCACSARKVRSPCARCWTWRRSPGGTGHRAQTMGYSVGGKTGTARKQEGKGYADRKYRSFFVGLAPVESPRIVVAVMVDEPNNGVYYGGAVAGPVFSETVQQTLRIMGVQPDMRCEAPDRDRGWWRSRSDAELAQPPGRGRLVARRVQRRAAVRQPPHAGGRWFRCLAWCRADGRHFVTARWQRVPCRAGGTRRRGGVWSSDDERIAGRCRPQGAGRPDRQRLPWRPSAGQLDVIAITGTNGKTSTAWWMAQLLSCACRTPLRRGRHAGHGPPAAGDRQSVRPLVPTGLTTPDPVLPCSSQLRALWTKGDRPAPSRPRPSAWSKGA
jgi:hypothetical protein